MMISGLCSTRYDIAEGSPCCVLGGLNRRICENMICASFRASNGSSLMLRAMSYRRSSCIMAVTSCSTCSGLLSASVIFIRTSMRPRISLMLTWCALNDQLHL